MVATGILSKLKSFKWTAPLNRITEISLDELKKVKMQRLTSTLARMWFENVEGHEVDIPEEVVLRVVAGKINGVFQYERAATMPKGFVFEADKMYHLLQQNSIKLWHQQDIVHLCRSWC